MSDVARLIQWCGVNAAMEAERAPTFAAKFREAATALQTLTDLAHEAAPLLGISASYGHGPARDGLRCAGFYYKAEDAARDRVLPAHCLSAMRELIAALTKEGKSA